MADFLDRLAQNAKETIEKGYYEVPKPAKPAGTPYISLKRAILNCKHAPVIAEIKLASPSLGVIKKNAEVSNLARAIETGGAIGISVLTEPTFFNGSLGFLAEARNQTKLPILMKDIVLSPLQLDAAHKIGANAVLLIEALFEREYCECNVHELIAYAHSKNLEVLLEAHTEDEFLSALKTDADLIGINNRDLKTLKVDLCVTKKILQRTDPQGSTVVSESGIKKPDDINLLRKYGAHAFLIGSSVMKADEVAKKVEEFVAAL
jgi:indole-3-glycerol phosphate synthase